MKHINCYCDFLQLKIIKMRYFFFSYEAYLTDTIRSIGNIFFPHEQFPSIEEVKSEIKTLNENLESYSIVINNIFEFKEQGDYDRFRDRTKRNINPTEQ